MSFEESTESFDPPSDINTNNNINSSFVGGDGDDGSHSIGKSSDSNTSSSPELSSKTKKSWSKSASEDEKYRPRILVLSHCQSILI